MEPNIPAWAKSVTLSMRPVASNSLTGSLVTITTATAKLHPWCVAQVNFSDSRLRFQEAAPLRGGWMVDCVQGFD